MLSNHREAPTGNRCAFASPRPLRETKMKDGCVSI
jgi:hypothetical protein